MLNKYLKKKKINHQKLLNKYVMFIINKWKDQIILQIKQKDYQQKQFKIFKKYLYINIQLIKENASLKMQLNRDLLWEPD